MASKNIVSKDTHYVLSNNKRLKSDVYSSTNQNDLPRQVELGYSGLGFGLSAPDTLASANEANTNNNIRIQREHVLVAAQKDMEATLDCHYIKNDGLKDKKVQLHLL